MKNKEAFKRLLKNNVKKYINKLIIAAIFSVVVAVSTSATAWILDPAIKKIFLEKNLEMLMIIPIGIIFAFAAKGLSLYFARSITIKVGLDVRNDLQQEMSNSILKADVYHLENKHSGKFISNFLADAGLITNLVSESLLRIMKDSLTLLCLTGLMFYQNWLLAIYALLIMPFAIFVARSIGKRVSKATHGVQVSTADLSTFISELIKGSRLTKIYQQEKFELERAKKNSTTFIEKMKKMHLASMRSTPIMEVITGFMVGGFIFISGYMVINEQLDINKFFSFLAAMMLAYQPVKSLGQIHIGISQGLAGVKRIFEVIDNEIFVKDKKDCKELEIKNASIKLNKVYFSYPESSEKAIKNINMEIDGGSFVALVGHSGSGKSTIFNLLPRFYDTENGSILIDGQAIDNVSIHSLRKNISIVSQDVVIFDDTIYSNIAYGNLEASKEKIMKAAKFAAANEFIEKLPKKYETLVGENGFKLSGGQKQRISIARALLKDCPIILLDEATSSLDAESESQVQSAIVNLTRDRTTIVIAHRLSTIKKAKKIFVLNNGEIIDSGEHNELLKKSDIYKNLYEKQIEMA